MPTFYNPGADAREASEALRGLANERGTQSCECVFREVTRSATNEMIQVIDKYRDCFGVEFLCRALRAAVRGFLTSRGYRAAKQRPVSARQLRDELLVSEIRRLHAKHYSVYGRRKMHALLRREGWEIGRDQTERLMKFAGVRGVRETKRVFTARPDRTAVLPASARDCTSVPSFPLQTSSVATTAGIRPWSGFAYVVFVTDVYSRRIVGWNIASPLKSEILPMQALDMADCRAGRTRNARVGVVVE